MKSKWTILLLILFFPVGLYLMWKNQHFSKLARVIITALFVIGILGAMLDDEEGPLSSEEITTDIKGELIETESPDEVTEETEEGVVEETSTEVQTETKAETVATVVPVVEPKKEEPKEETKTTTNQLQAVEVPVVSIIDGDTIKVEIGQKEESVRFLLIDTPEITRGKNEPFGQEAKELVQQMLRSGMVKIEQDVGERDRYGRLLMYVYDENGVSVQEELLRQGLARVAYVFAPNTKHVDRYYEIQKEAQQKAIGIWSIENYATESGFNADATKVTTAPPKTETPKSASDDCNIKGNINSKGDKIYHVPGGAFYDRTDIDTSKGERWFCSKEEAEAAGWRASQR